MPKIYLLNNQKYEDVINLEIFKIKYIEKNIDFGNYDALIFTSKNAIYSIDSFGNEWKNINSYVIAKKTSDVAINLGGKVSFIGNSGHGNEFAKELVPLLKNKKVLFLKAKRVVSSLVDILKENKIDINEEIVYETVCNDKLESITIEKGSIVIFTSPSSVDCFFKKYSWNNSLKAIVIGKTTAKYLPENVDFEISNYTSVDECVNLAKRYLF
ncbi:uroporphyrinogen III synthase [Malaciobacter molluscorum LMG 25693]|uniref:Uroporphyrinogen III synthase n=1 Tax=Malaciobacter molluscorum LMG 25693 TaxID=870501 RepID=A0A2G1DGP0_9BACT|nr:uroporphyrinogen-III synthase [Malaciobacter molluscorum]AXX92461.1 uroporphyrinogen III synthase [Malaciobacter molluscorum LMG 25693]PHO17668.1 uroporphyrinogen III synthase [Malaciobacter molluscorum LMG 25693]RXJ93434.1 uroporphyrinogen III synthase [Malaciobacter molluscorum]